MRILFTSSDPGSAQQNDSIAKYIKKRKNSLIGYISSQVAEEYYSSDFDKILCFPFSKQIDNNLLRDFIIEFKPDFIFLGLSTNKNSIDYKVCKISEKMNIQTGSIQDYYGYVGSYNNAVKPDYFFVIDEYAKTLTENANICESEKIFITGSPKHFDYYSKIKKWDKDFQKLHYKNNEIIFFLQPLEIPGIKTNMIDLCKALNEVKPGYKLNVKPHPLDKNSSTLKYLSNKYFLNIIDPKNTPVELLLIYYNNIFNCFSTISYDYYFLSKYLLSFNKSKLFNLFLGKDIFYSMSKLNFDITMTPQYQIGINIKDQNSLIKNLQLIFNSSQSNGYKLKSNNNNNFAAEKIMNIIQGL